MTESSFIYHVPTKIFFGPAEFGKLGKEVAKYGKRVLVAYGGGSIRRIGLYDNVMAQLKDAGLEVFEMSGIEPNPRIENVRKGTQICKQKKIDVVLAVGGGSTIDCSKFICAGALTDDDPWEWFVDLTKPLEKALPLLSVLTLAATGSEMDTGGVISNAETNEKYGRLAPVLLPKASFLNPELTYSVPAFQTAAGSADIMSHTMETYFTQDHDLVFLDEFLEGLLRTVIRFAPIAMAEPNNYEARANLMWASSWAINGFGNGGKTQAWSVHPMEHELSAYYDITHGLGLAILTPEWMRHILERDSQATAPKLAQFAVNVFHIDPAGKSNVELANEGINELEDFFVNQLKLAPSLSAIDIDARHFADMAKHALEPRGQKGDGVLHGFIDLTEDDIVDIYNRAL